MSQAYFLPFCLARPQLAPAKKSPIRSRHPPGPSPLPPPGSPPPPPGIFNKKKKNRYPPPVPAPRTPLPPPRAEKKIKNIRNVHQVKHFIQGSTRWYGLPLGAKKSTQTFFVQSFSTTLRVVDVRTENAPKSRIAVR